MEEGPVEVRFHWKRGPEEVIRPLSGIGINYPAAELRGIKNLLKNLLPLDGGGLRWG
jgi:hypothetical protein